MAFELEPTHYALTFEDPRLKGLQVTMDRMSVGEALQFDELRFTKAENVLAATKNTRAVYEIVAAHIVEWSIDDTPDLPGLLRQDELIVTAIIPAWMTAMRGITAPLPDDSNSGQPFPEDAIPMETLSPSPSS